MVARPVGGGESRGKPESPHISRRELLSQLRSHGRDDLRSVRAAFLEPNGRVTFLFRESSQ